MSGPKPSPALSAAQGARPDLALGYSGRDYDSLRRLMLDQVSTLMPGSDWGHPANPMAVLVEALAAAGDYLSYQLDAVTTEGYLPTARLRRSVKRHARLLDYRLHDGCNARAWLLLTVDRDAVLPSGTRAVTAQAAARGPILSPDDPSFAFSSDAVFFETLESTILRTAFNDIEVLRANDGVADLPAGATGALFGEAAFTLTAGDWLAFDDARGAHVVRVVAVAARPQNVGGKTVEIRWHVEDALPRSFQIADVSVTANVVLLDEGARTTHVFAEPVAIADLGVLPLAGSSIVSAPPPWTRGDYAASAAAMTAVDPADAVPSIVLVPADPHAEPWTAWPDLLAATRLTRAFVVDLDESGAPELRFGDGVLGRAPGSERIASVIFREGGGAAGNIAAGGLVHLITDAPVTALRQPLPATGGVDRGDLESARRLAPDAFRDQRRIASAPDAAAVAYAHPMAGRVTATATRQQFRIHVEPASPFAVEDVLTAIAPDVVRALPAGSTVTLLPPRPMAIDMMLTVVAAPGVDPDQVRRRLAVRFGAEPLGGSPTSFFASGQRPMGAPLFFSDVLEAALAVPGVAGVDSGATATRFSAEGVDGLMDGFIPLGPDQTPVAGAIAFEVTST